MNLITVFVVKRKERLVMPMKVVSAENKYLKLALLEHYSERRIMDIGTQGTNGNMGGDQTSSTRA